MAKETKESWLRICCRQLQLGSSTIAPAPPSQLTAVPDPSLLPIQYCCSPPSQHSPGGISTSLTSPTLLKKPSETSRHTRDGGSPKTATCVPLRPRSGSPTLLLSLPPSTRTPNFSPGTKTLHLTHLQVIKRPWV